MAEKRTEALKQATRELIEAYDALWGEMQLAKNIVQYEIITISMTTSPC